MLRLSRMKKAFLAGAAALALAGCSDPTPAAPAAVPPSVSWQEPARYSYTVDSRCGERLLIGTYTLKVVDGKVTEMSRSDAAPPVVPPENFPTLKALLDEYLQAVRAGAFNARLETDPADGHPTRIELDPALNSIDDEACYVISGYVPG